MYSTEAFKYALTKIKRRPFPQDPLKQDYHAKAIAETDRDSREKQ